MKMNLIKKITLCVITLAATSLSIMAAPYEKGQKVESFQAVDQNENAFVFQPNETRFLLISHDMDTGKKANAALSPLGKDYLTNHKSVFVANIFGMPGIGRMFALPKMRKYNHRIILADDAALIARFPAQQGKVTVLALSGGKVQSIQYWTPGTESVDAYLK